MDKKAFYLFWFWGLLHSASSIEVKTNDGIVEGNTLKLFNGRNVNEFFGVPFAAPPVGENRFLSPKPVQPWNGTLDAKTKRSGCLQAASKEEKQNYWFMSESSESEDCLYLNIWTPTPSKNEKFAVLIWIFSGGFAAGSANLPTYDGSILATEKNVIVVTVNYRLSLFGFAYLNSSDVPGNMGLQDQIQAIQWAKDNIEYFGGDPNRITLFGESAGSAAVGFHLTNMNIYGLFQNGIMESGSIDMRVITKSEEEALNTSMDLARSVNCMSEDKQEIVKCLRSKAPEELLANYIPWPENLAFQFPAVRNGIEVPFSTSEISVPEDKRKNLLSGDVMREEGYLLPFFYPKKQMNEDTTISEAELRETLTNAFKLSDQTFQDLVISMYKNFDGTYNKSQVRIEAADIVTDAGMICPQLDFTKQWVTKHNKVYYYYFKYSASVPLKKMVPKWLGSIHGEEIPFAFGTPLSPQKKYSQYEKKLSNEIMTYWSNFAKTGNPNRVDHSNTPWPEVPTEGPFQYLEVDKDLTAKELFKGKECDFWTNIYPGMVNIQGQLNKGTS